MIIKIVYFDESTATDFIHIIDGGKSEEATEEIKKGTMEIAAKADTKADIKLKWLPFIGVNASAEANLELSKIGNNIIKKALSNTILTDYIKKVEENKMVKVFKGYNIWPYPESFSYYKMMTPYLKMTKGEIPTDNGITLDISQIDEALESGRGYYELIAENLDEKVVLRFNIKAFRNNYGISDLVKMNLTCHAIKVGEIKESSLAMVNEFSKRENEASINGYDLMDDMKNNDSILNKSFKVYDVILAGVENNDQD
jgi:hypothetical protein